MTEYYLCKHEMRNNKVSKINQSTPAQNAINTVQVFTCTIYFCCCTNNIHFLDVRFMSTVAGG